MFDFVFKMLNFAADDDKATDEDAESREVRHSYTVYTCRRLIDLSLYCIYLPAIDRSLCDCVLYIYAGD